MPQPPKGEPPPATSRTRPASATSFSSDEERLLTTPIAALLDLLPDAAILFDRHGRVVQANPAAQHLLALGDVAETEAPLSAPRRVPRTPRDLEGRRIPQAEWPLARLLRGEAVTGDSPLVMGAAGPDGREVLVSCAGSPIYDPAGTLIGAIAIFRDVTAQVWHETERAESLRREQQARAEAEAHAVQLEAVLEVAPSRITMFDAAGTIVRFNRAAPRQAGPRRGGERLEELQTAYALRTLAGEPFPMAEFPVARALRGETVSNVEMIRRGANGADEVLLIGAAPVVDAAGQVQGAVAVAHDVTALRAAERAAAERAGQLEAIFDAMADAIFVYDAAGRIIRSNPAASELLALDARPEYATLSLEQRIQLLAPRDREGQPLSHPPLPVSEALRGAVLKGETALELILHRMDGCPIDISLTAAPIRDSSSGQIVGAVSILRDVSDRRRLEREILARASQLEASVAAITDIVHVYNREGRLVHTNAAARALGARLFDPGYLAQPFDRRLAATSLTDDQGRPLAPEQTPAARVLHGEVLTGEQATDVWVRMPDGQDLLLNTTGAPVRDPDGAIIGAVIVSRDVTERRRLEHRTRDALDAMLAMAHALVDEVPAVSGRDSASAASVGRATAQRLVELARGMLGCERASLLAYSPESGQSEPLAMSGLTPEVEHIWRTTVPRIVPADYLDDVDIEALLAGRPVVSRYARAKARGYPTYDAAGTLIAPLTIGGKLIGTLSLGYGALPHEYTSEELALAQAVAHLCALIIERDRLLGQRAAAEARVLALEDANRRMDEFLGIASHELRTPVTSILTNLQLLARRRRQGRPADAAGAAESEVEAAREAQLLARAERQLGRLVRLIDDLVDVSRIRTGKLELRPERTDLVVLVREEVEGQRLAHAGRTITLQLPHDLAGRAAWIMADADRIGQVLTNHLSNALKYSQDDRPVEVRLQIERRVARVTVRDEGPGIPEDERAHIWEVFHRVPGIDVQSGSGVGLGLGLHIARTIVERHGGQVGVESVPGQGSSFWFTVPLATSEDRP